MLADKTVKLRCTVVLERNESMAEHDNCGMEVISLGRIKVVAAEVKLSPEVKWIEVVVRSEVESSSEVESAPEVEWCQCPEPIKSLTRYKVGVCF